MAEIVIRRHQAIFNPTQHKDEIHIIGVGATGSRIFQALVELGCMNITCHDFDVVEPHNLANQAYDASDIGELKVEACRKLYCRKTGSAEVPKGYKFSPLALPDDTAPMLTGYVFLLTDSMSSRKEIYTDCIKDNPMIERVIETRMASTHGNVFVFDPKDKEEADKWEASLIDDGVAELSPCGQPMSVGATASIIANFAIWQYILANTNEKAMCKQIDMYMKPFDITGN